MLLFFIFLFGLGQEFGIINHIVEKKETIYGISKRYQCSIRDLKKYNPFLEERGLQIGDILTIKTISNQQQCLEKKIVSPSKNEFINLVMFLPLNNNTNNSLKKVSNQFFIGAKIALDSISKCGQKINLRLVDCADDKLFNDFLNKNDFSTIDLIIGPLKKNHILKISDQLIKYGIPIVSPLSNSFEYTSKINIISSEPVDLFMKEQIIQEVLEVHNNDKIYLFYGNDKERSDAKKFSDQLNKIKKNLSIEITNNFKDIKITKHLLTEQDQSIIVVLLSEEEKNVDYFLQHISTLNPENIKLFSTYYHENFESNIYKSLLKKWRLVYTTERKINLTGIVERHTIAKFQEDYCTKPSKYSIIGFDVTYDSLQRILGNKDFDFSSTSIRLATKFDYIQKQSLGAYYNKGFWLIRI